MASLRVSHRWLMLCLLACISAISAPDCRAAAKPKPKEYPRFEIPIERTVLLDGVVRYWVPVTIGGSGPIPALLDTGSTGLLVLSRAVKKTSLRRLGRVSYTYASGESLSGYLARAQVHVGSASTGVTVSFGVVETVKCVADKPKCSSAKLKPEDYGIGGDGVAGEGFQAILGIGPDQNVLANPLAFMGDKRWIIDLPLPGRAGPGTLILNPREPELAGFSLFPQSKSTRTLRGGLKAAIDGCLVEHRSGTTLCGPVVPDTGGVLVDVRVAKDPAITVPWRNAEFALEFGTGTGKLAVPFDVKPNSSSWVYFETQKKGPLPVIIAGILPYLKCLVLFDYRSNSFGFKPR